MHVHPTVQLIMMADQTPTVISDRLIGVDLYDFRSASPAPTREARETALMINLSTRGVRRIVDG